MQDLRLISIWSAKRPRDFYVNYHSHKYHELVYYPYGNGQTVIGDQTHLFSDNCFAVIPYSIEHNETHYSDSEVICLEFSGAQDLPIGFHKDPSRAIYKILKEILGEVKYQDYGYNDMLALKLNELLLYILRNEKITTDTKNFEYIINYLQENFHEHISLSDCAEQLNISYDYFQHKFKAITGCSPQQYLMERRLIAAAKMLKAGIHNCTEIAYRCGFCTSAQFSALFKRRYGLTPLQFKREYA